MLTTWSERDQYSDRQAARRNGVRPLPAWPTGRLKLPDERAPAMRYAVEIIVALTLAAGLVFLAVYMR